MNLALKNNVEEMLNNYVAGLVTLLPNTTSSVLLYGSTDIGNAESDIDICTIVPKYSNNQKSALATFTIDFHRRYGYLPDFDVPYENKVLYSHFDLQRAFSALAFPIRNGNFMIPEIAMEPVFLSSDAVRDRLILNVLTTKHSIIHGLQTEIDQFSRQAWETILRVVFSNNENRPISIGELIKILCIDKRTMKKYKDYLGYDYDNQQIRAHLEQSLMKTIPALIKKKKIRSKNNRLSCCRSWIEDLINQRLNFTQTLKGGV